MNQFLIYFIFSLIFYFINLFYFIRFIKLLNLLVNVFLSEQGGDGRGEFQKYKILFRNLIIRDGGVQFR